MKEPGSTVKSMEKATLTLQTENFHTISGVTAELLAAMLNNFKNQVYAIHRLRVLVIIYVFALLLFFRIQKSLVSINF